MVSTLPIVWFRTCLSRKCCLFVLVILAVLAIAFHIFVIVPHSSVWLSVCTSSTCLEARSGPSRGSVRTRQSERHVHQDEQRNYDKKLKLCCLSLLVFFISSVSVQCSTVPHDWLSEHLQFESYFKTCLSIRNELRQMTELRC